MIKASVCSQVSLTYLWVLGSTERDLVSPEWLESLTESGLRKSDGVITLSPQTDPCVRIGFGCQIRPV